MRIPKLKNRSQKHDWSPKMLKWKSSLSKKIIFNKLIFGDFAVCTFEYYKYKVSVEILKKDTSMKAKIKGSCRILCLNSYRLIFYKSILLLKADFH